MEQNKVEVVIAGKTYHLRVADSPSHIEKLAMQLNRRINDMLIENDTISFFDAAVLVSLDLLDENARISGNIDNIRTQIKTYLDDAASARMDAERALRELSEAKAEISRLKSGQGT